MRVGTDTPRRTLCAWALTAAALTLTAAAAGAMYHYQSVAGAYLALIHDDATREALRAAARPGVPQAVADALVRFRSAVWLASTLAAIAALGSLLLTQRFDRRRWLTLAALVALVATACVLWLQWRFDESLRWG